MSPLWDELVELGAAVEIAALLDHPEVAVRYCAAARLHRHDWRRAREVMEPIAAEPPPLGSFARRLLERWSRGDVEWRSLVLAFTGTVTAAEQSIHISGPRWVTDLRCDFTVAIDVEDVPSDGPLRRGENLFAIRSLGESFGADAGAVVGASMRFECDARERAGEWQLSGFRGRLL